MEPENAQTEPSSACPHNQPGACPWCADHNELQPMGREYISNLMIECRQASKTTEAA